MMKRLWYCMMTLPAVCLVAACCSTPAAAHDAVGPRSMICLKEFPTDPAFFNDELKPYAAAIIAGHGLEEWKAVVLTNEFHHHMGFWSVLGAKMGIRARELLRVPFGGLAVVSSAGFMPPRSCLNDGLQVATGATLGRGTIRVNGTGDPVVIFTGNGKKVIMKVKPEVIIEMEQRTGDVERKHPFQSSAYFYELDRISVEYWLKWDRAKLFSEEITATPAESREGH